MDMHTSTLDSITELEAPAGLDIWAELIREGNAELALQDEVRALHAVANCHGGPLSVRKSWKSEQTEMQLAGLLKKIMLKVDEKL